MIQTDVYTCSFGRFQRLAAALDVLVMKDKINSEMKKVTAFEDELRLIQESGTQYSAEMKERKVR